MVTPDDVNSRVGGLADALDAPVALAVGDSAADLPMLALAQRACTPAGTDPELRGHARRMRRPHQAGLLQAVDSLVGHGPRRCPTCALPRPAGGAAVLAASLRAKDATRAGKVTQLVRLLAA